MNNLGEIISEELFINSFHIYKNYCEKSFILDVNLRLLKEHFSDLDEEDARKYYKKFIETDLVYSLPELFSTDIVSVPKEVTGIRNYRFFSTFSIVLYGAIGLLFVDCCSKIINDLDLDSNKGKIFFIFSN